MKIYCNQKERVQNHIVFWLPARPQASMCSWSSAHGSHLWSSHSTLTPYWLSQTPIAKPETYKCFAFHAATTQNSHCASPASPHSHKCQQRKFFHHKLYTLPESTSMIPIKCSQNTRFPLLSSPSLSLSLSLSRIPLQQLGQLPGVAENSSIQPSCPANNRRTPHYLLPRSFASASLLFSSSCCPKFFPPNQTSWSFLPIHQPSILPVLLPRPPLQLQTDYAHKGNSIPHNSAPPIGLHAHSVATAIWVSLCSIPHTASQASHALPCSINGKAVATKANDSRKQKFNFHDQGMFTGYGDLISRYNIL